MSTAKRSRQSPSTKTEFSSAHLLAAPVLFFVVLRGLATIADTAALRLWGLDFAGWLPHNGILHLLLWLPLLFAYPLFKNRSIDSGGSDSPAKRSGNRDAGEEHTALSSRLLPAMLLIAGAAVLAGSIQVAYGFLGDGTWYAAELFRSMGDPGYANSMIKPSAWLTGIVLDGYARAFQPADIRLPFQYAGIAGMVISTAAVFLLTLREKLPSVVLAAVLLLCATGSLVFFGYIELYAFVYAFSVAYFIASWQCFRGEAPYWLPGVFLLLAVLFGASSIIWLPSYLLLLHWKFRGEEGGFPLRRAAGVLILLPLIAIAGAYIFGFAEGDSAYIVPLAPFDRIIDGLSTGWQRYTLFLPDRWADILNALLLTLGGGTLMLPFVLWLGKREGVLLRPAVLFGLTSAAGGMLLLVFGNTFLGLARDWDVAALAGLGIAVLLLLLLLELSGKRQGLLRAVLPLLAAVSVSQFILWTMVNADEEASALRFEALVSMDAGLVLPMNTFTGYENLRKFHQSGAQQEAYFHTMRSMIATGYRRDVSYAEYLSAALKLTDAGHRRAELQWLINALLEDIHRGSEGTQSPAAAPRFYREFSVRLLLSALQIGEHALVDEALKYFKDLQPTWPERKLLELQEDSEVTQTVAIERLDAAIDDATDDAFLMMTAAGLHAGYGNAAKAAQLYESALKREPTLYPSWYLAAAAFHLRTTGDRQAAQRYLQACLENAPESPSAKQAAELLQTIR